MKRMQFAARSFLLVPILALLHTSHPLAQSTPAPGIIAPRAQSQPLAPHDKLLRDIYQELIEINTTDSAGDCTIAARAMSARLKTGGYTDAEILTNITSLLLRPTDYSQI